MELPDFELIEFLADGPQTSVFKARHRTLDVMVALKQWKQPLSVEQRRRFLSECQIQHRLSDHPQVVRLLWAGVPEDGRAWLATELFEMSLQQRLETGSLPGLEEAAALADDLLAGLSAIHTAGLLHRDIKPANVLLKHGRAAVADLGIAMELSKGTEHAGAGTGGFVAPELANGAAPSCRSDVYSAAATLDCLFQGANRPAALDNLLDGATSFHPADRPADAVVFRAQFTKAVSGRNDGPSAPSDSPQRRKLVRLAVLVGVLTMAGAGLAKVGIQWDSAESRRPPAVVIPVASAQRSTPSTVNTTPAVIWPSTSPPGQQGVIGVGPSPPFPVTMNGWHLHSTWTDIHRMITTEWTILPGPNLDPFPSSMTGCDNQRFLVRWRALQPGRRIAARWVEDIGEIRTLPVTGAAKNQVIANGGWMAINGCQTPAFRPASPSDVFTNITFAVQQLWPVP